MSLFALLILALVQGLTEFLPVSSSGHLVLAKHFLGFKEQGLEMETWVHLATLAALLVYFWRDILRLTLSSLDSLRSLGTTLSKGPRRQAATRVEGSLFGKGEARPEESNWVPLILVSTLITGVFGIAFRKFFVSTYTDMRLLWWGFIATAVILIATRWAPEKRDRIGWLDAVLFGLAQAFSILPSVSRSGATIACLMFLGVRDATAFRYSFLASIPAVGAAFLLELNVGSFEIFSPAGLAAAFVIAFVSGLASLFFLRRFVERNRFHFFGYYCLLLGAAGLLFVN